MHLPAEHRLSTQAQLTLGDLADDVILVSGGQDSGGFTDRIEAAFAAVDIVPRTRPDPYPDLGLQAVREGLGIVIYARSAFPADLAGSAFVALSSRLGLPFHLAVRECGSGAAARVVVAVAAGRRERPAA